MTAARNYYEKNQNKILLDVCEQFENDWDKHGDEIESEYNQQIKKYNEQNGTNYIERDAKMLKQHWDEVVSETNKDPWTPQEEEQLEKLCEQHGRKWKVISEKLGTNRSYFNVMNTYKRIQRQKNPPKSFSEIQIKPLKKPAPDKEAAKRKLINMMNALQKEFLQFMEDFD